MLFGRVPHPGIALSCRV